MHIFKDRQGTEWIVDINVDAIRRVKSLLSIDLMDLLSDGKFIDRLTGDPCLLVDILYVICKPQADEASVSDCEFGRRMAGDSVDDATQALLDDFVDFFPSRKRPVLQAALSKIKAVEARMLTMAEAAINDPKIDEEIEKAFTPKHKPAARARAKASA